MKSLARGVVWWPGIDGNLQEKVRECSECQLHQKSPALAPLHPWEWPERSWTRLHIDYAGPFQGKMFLIVVDAHSKWLEVVTVPSANSLNTIEKLRVMFATHGLPEVIVSDNGSAFTSAEFQEFAKRNGIRHVTTAPYHPASNGQAERAVQTVKAALKKKSSESVQTRLSRFLFQYRITTHTTTGTSPAELLMGRSLRSHLDLMKPDVSARVQRKLEQQKVHHDRHSLARIFTAGEMVYIKDFPSGSSWLPGTILKAQGPLSYHVTLEDGRVVRRHVDHVRIRTTADCQPAPLDDDVDLLPNTPEAAESAETDSEPSVTVPRRSTRVSHPPDRYEPAASC